MTKIRLLEGYKYELMEDFDIYLHGIRLGFDGPYTSTCIDGEGTHLRIRAGYAWDGSSIPLKKYFRWIFDSDKRCKIPSLVHDDAYQMMRAGLIDLKHRPYFDQLYRDMLLARGMWKWQAGWRHLAVQTFSEGLAKPQPEKRGRIIEAE